MHGLKRELRYDAEVARHRNQELLAAFGQAVRVARARKGLSQAELAVLAEPPIDRALLGRIELGRYDLGLTLVERIASALHLSVVQLMEATAQELRQREAGEKLVPRPAPQPSAAAEPQAKAKPDDRPSIASCYIVEGGRLLMLRRQQPDGTLEWTAVSGKIESGETPEEAAVRETMEEVGVAIVVKERLGDRVHPATGRHLIYLTGRILAGTAHLVDHEENMEMEWVPIPEALERWAGLKGGVFGPVREYLTAAMVQQRGGGA